MDKELISKLVNAHLGSQLELYMSKRIIYDKYDIYLSDLIGDAYWNFATNIKSESKEAFLVDWEEIKNIFKDYNRQPVVYFTPLSSLYDVRHTLGLDVLYTDSWLILEDLKSFPEYKSKLEITIQEVNENNIEEFINGVAEGFSSDDPNDPYQGIADSYKIAIRNGFSKKSSHYKIKHYIIKYDDKTVGTATANYDEEVACIYNVTTNKQHKNNGICKEIMSHLIKDLLNIGVKAVCLQTEKGFYTEEVYLKLGFKKIFEASAFGEQK